MRIRHIVASVLITSFVVGCQDRVLTTELAKSGPLKLGRAHLNGHSEFFASPNGVPGGDGLTPQTPWSLANALTQTSAMGTGDTLFLLNGTYSAPTSGFEVPVGLNGVVIRSAPNQWAVIDGANVDNGTQGPSVLVVHGSSVVIQGIEIEDTSTARQRDGTCVGNCQRPHLIYNNASGNSFKGLVLHDGGIGFMNDGGNTTIEGCVIYNNGGGKDRRYGHGAYIHNAGGTVTLRHNIIFNSFDYGIQVYTGDASSISGIHLDSNIVFDNGLVSDSVMLANILYGRDTSGPPPTGGLVQGNYVFQDPAFPIVGLAIGYWDRTHDVSQQGDIAVAGNLAYSDTALEVGTWTTATFSGNSFNGTAEAALRPASSSYTWTNNWYDTRIEYTADTTGWSIGGTRKNFDAWKVGAPASSDGEGFAIEPSAWSAIGDAGDDGVAGSGLATILWYRLGSPASFGFTPPASFASGDTYRIYDVFDLSTPIASGTCCGTITVTPSSYPTQRPFVGGWPSLPSAGVVRAYIARLVPPSLNVSISGPTFVRSGETCMWSATASRGLGGYTYQWQANGQVVGGTSDTLYYANGGSTFTLTVSATDALGSSGGTGIQVKISSTAAHCAVQ